jgi:hypothetical protein
MFFKKKSKDNEDKCIGCGKHSNVKYSYCPYCGESKIDELEDAKDFGLLGKNDELANLNPLANAGVMEQLIGTLMKTAMKTMVSEIKNPQNNEALRPEIQQTPNGIKISIGQPNKNSKKEKKAPEQSVTDDQIERMSSLPRAQAKTSIKRFNDKVIYELSASGVSALEDIFVSKLESGYEIKAIGKSKVYVNSIPVNLPLIRYGITPTGIVMEFDSTQQSK